MNSYNKKKDFDDVAISHQMKSQFNNPTKYMNKIQKNKRSPFVDCFTNDSVIAPATFCPPGVNSAKQTSHFENSFQCPTGLHYSTTSYKCEEFNNNQPLDKNKQRIQQNRKSAFFNSIVE